MVQTGMFRCARAIFAATLVVAGDRHEMTLTGDRGFGASMRVDDASAGVYRVELTDTERVAYALALDMES